jgi:peptidoglycan L-alanyl-D-glutamate endopeptidase CwlK
MISRETYLNLLNISERQSRRLREYKIAGESSNPATRPAIPLETNPAVAMSGPSLHGFSYSARSKQHLATCHPVLIRVMEYVLTLYDHVIIEGHRGKEAQNAAFAAGHSKLRWPNGNHNQLPSIAVDAAPYDPVTKGVNWNTDHRTAAGMANIKRFYHFAGLVQGVAHRMNVPIRWGGDWNTNTRFDDQTFDDLVHFELLNP